MTKPEDVLIALGLPEQLASTTAAILPTNRNLAVGVNLAPVEKELPFAILF